MALSLLLIFRKVYFWRKEKDKKATRGQAAYPTLKRAKSALCSANSPTRKRQRRR